MAYGPAPEAVAPANAWLEAHQRRFGHFIAGTWSPGEGETFETANPATGRPLARLAQAGPGDVDRAVRAARAAQPGWWELGGHAPGAPSLRAGPAHPEAQPVLRGAGVTRQWQADPGVARHRRAAGGAALLLPRRVGAAHGAGVARPGAGRRHRSDHSVELPASHARVEGRARIGDGEHGRAQAGGVHLADRASLRRAVYGSRTAGRRRQHHHG